MSRTKQRTYAYSPEIPRNQISIHNARTNAMISADVLIMACVGFSTPQDYWKCLHNHIHCTGSRENTRWTHHNERVASTQDSWGSAEDVCISMMVTPAIMIALLVIISLLNLCVCGACPRTNTMYVYVHHCRCVTCILRDSSIHGRVNESGPNLFK